MRILATAVLFLAMPSMALAENARHQRSAPAVHATPAYRPNVHTQPAYRAPVGHIVGHLPTHSAPPTPTAGTSLHDRRVFRPDHRVVATPRSGHVNRPVARHVRLHGGVLAVPAVVVFGVPVILQVPGIGPVSVLEDRYRTLYDLLASENPDDWERAYTDLQRIQHETPNVSAIVDDAPRNSGATNMLPPGFGVVHPPVSASSAVSDDNVRDLAEPLSFDGPPPKRNERLW